MSLHVVSLFAGIGGIDIAFERAGARTVLFCEADKHARTVLARHWPDTPIHPDVRELTADDLRNAGARPDNTVVCAGFPCQDLSIAGGRRGMGEDTRSGLFWQIIRLLADFHARWVLLENVPGLLSSHGGRDMGAVIGALADLGYGYAWRVLDAQYAGVPQRRRRVVIVGHLGAPWSVPAEVLLEPYGGSGNLAAGVAARQGVAGAASRGVVAALTATGVGTCGADDNQAQAGHLVVSPLLARGGKGVSDDEAASGHLIPVTFQKVVRAGQRDVDGNLPPDKWEHREVSATLSPFDLGSDSRAVELVVTTLGDHTHALTAEGHDASEDGTGRGTPIIAATLTTGTSSPGVSAPGRRQEDDVNLVAFDPKAGGDHTSSGAFEDGTGITPTLGGPRPHAVATHTEVRRLTPRECERLQGHPDDWTAGQSDSQRYKQLGNGVAVSVFEWVAARLIAQHEQIVGAA